MVANSLLLMIKRKISNCIYTASSSSAEQGKRPFLLWLLFYCREVFAAAGSSGCKPMLSSCHFRPRVLQAFFLVLTFFFQQLRSSTSTSIRICYQHLAIEGKYFFCSAGRRQRNYLAWLLSISGYFADTSLY
jgi:hypothetical protein